MKTFSLSWKSSTRPNKQRKYRYNAPLHIKGKFVHAHLSKELKAKYSIRAIRVRAGDKVRVMRGQFKKTEAKVDEVDLKNSKLYLAKVEVSKRDGSKARFPIDPSNVMIVELNLDDKNRLGSKKSETKHEAKAEAKPAAQPKKQEAPKQPAKTAPKAKPEAKK